MIFSSYAVSFYSGFQFADGTFWAIFILSAFFIVIKKGGQPFERYESILLATLMFFTALSSPMHIMAFVFLIAYHLYLQIRLKKKHLMVQNITNLKQITGLLTVYGLLFVLYLLLSGSLTDFYFSTVTFNNNYFYFRDHVQIINPKVADFYLHSTIDIFKHFKGLMGVEGTAFVAFLKSLKAIFVPGTTVDFPAYLKIIFTDLYNNFFSFEIFILLFYAFGFISLFLNKYKTLAIFSIIFIFAIRLRVPEKIHEAPYYLFSYWLLAIAFTLLANNVYKNKQRAVNSLGILLMFLVVSLFIQKNMYDFRQTAFNSFPNNSEGAVEFIKNNTNPDDKIIVVANESARYYWDARRFPASYFVNYFPWYGWSDDLKMRWLDALNKYNGKYIVVNRDFWLNYQHNTADSWINEMLGAINESYHLSNFQKYDYILYRVN